MVGIVNMNSIVFITVLGKNILALLEYQTYLSDVARNTEIGTWTTD